jgi:hypothetical protein
MHTLPALYPGQLHLLLAARPTRYELVNALIARLAAGGQLLVLDGGNCFQAHRIARLLRRSTPHLEAALNNIHVARAFTCYQVVTLLAETPASPVPTLVLDLLTTFQDENVHLSERRRLLEISLSHLRRLSSRAPTLISVAQDGTGDLPGDLLHPLEEHVDQIWHFESPPPVEPLRLL